MVDKVANRSLTAKNDGVQDGKIKKILSCSFTEFIQKQNKVRFKVILFADFLQLFQLKINLDFRVWVFVVISADRAFAVGVEAEFVGWFVCWIFSREGSVQLLILFHKNIIISITN